NPAPTVVGPGPGLWQAWLMSFSHSQHSASDTPFDAGYFAVDGETAVAGNAAYWTEAAAEYLAEFGEFLGDVQFRWCPEGLLESEAHLLGPLAQLRTQRVLEVGAGAGQCGRWLVAQGV